VTWGKFGVEFRGQVMQAGLSDTAARTHFEGLLWLYEAESPEPRIGKHLLRTVAGSDGYEQAARELVAAGFWRDEGDAYVVDHHAEVYRQSLAAQLAHREQERARQRRKRRPRVGPNVGANGRATQTDRQTTSTEGKRSPDLATCLACDRPARRGCRTCWEHAALETATA
jgi:hypothetical protein